MVLCSHWFVLTIITPESISILLLSSSKSDDSFPWKLSFIESLETQSSYICSCSFEKSDKYSSFEVQLSSVSLFSPSEALFISSDFDSFMMYLVLSSKFVLSFLSLLDILYKKAPSTIVLVNAMKSVIRKRLLF